MSDVSLQASFCSDLNWIWFYGYRFADLWKENSNLYLCHVLFVHLCYCVCLFVVLSIMFSSNFDIELKVVAIDVRSPWTQAWCNYFFLENVYLRFYENVIVLWIFCWRKILIVVAYAAVVTVVVTVHATIPERSYAERAASTASSAVIS